MDKKIGVYIEIEKGSNQKFEYNHVNKKLELDRLIAKPYVYPFAYGFIPNTKGKDNDELDALILTDTHTPSDFCYDVYIIGVLVMEDEQGMDEKMLCVLEEDYNTINDISAISDTIKNKIRDFFTHYKNNTDGRWSKVYGFENKAFALRLYKECLII